MILETTRHQESESNQQRTGDCNDENRGVSERYSMPVASDEMIVTFR